MTYAVEIDKLSKIYHAHIGRGKFTALDSVSLQVAENEVYGFLGRNGAGKTTTIKILCSLLRQTSGTAKLFGYPARSRDARRHIGYLPENPYFYEYLTAKETIDFYCRLHGLDATGRRARWTDLCDRLDLGDLADRRVRGYSKGQRQRLGFAVALVGNPEVLILDEPMSGLDPLGRRMIRELILALRDEKKTLFFSSHVLGDVEQICDKVAILVRGQLRRTGRIEELLAHKVQRVEVIVDGINEGHANTFASEAEHHRASEAGHHFVTQDLESANRIAASVLKEGGHIVQLEPIKESLEDYFMREQEAKS